MSLIASTEYDSAIEQLYQDMYLPMCIRAESALNDRDLAEEAVQDVFQIACSKPEDVFAYGSPEGWLMITLRNVIKNIKRRQVSLSNLLMRFACQVDAMDASPENDICFEDMCERVLGKDDYRLLKRVAHDKCTMLEAAKEHGITVHNCKKKVLRAKEKLKRCLETEDADISKQPDVKMSLMKGGKHYAGKGKR